MNSYPPELLVQLAPIMFVAGLDLPANVSSPSTPGTPQDPFVSLISRLRDALISQRKVAIWQPEKARVFQSILVDRDVRFPPRKLQTSEDQMLHSPLSPLTPSSPLHPDGLIAPIWIRKHTTLVPSVFVLFSRLFELPPHNPRSPLDVPDPDHERERQQEERRQDTELAAEIALRKRSTNEYNIKLTVVLIASRKMLDDPTLDSRLTFIRRQSSLDSRAALFVLSPVSTSELGEFVRSLQQALYDPAVEYYTSHSKRVRRKRNKHSQNVPIYPVSPLSTSAPRPLRPEGWTVRYEYKMASFAEFRGEDEVALKHYQDAYTALATMFGSTIILPPRTKRWAEAKVLIDCINIKVVKLYLYNNEHGLALSQHNMHMRRFGDFSRGWGIGEDTFEYWSWLARQYRVLAELLEQGTRTTLTIPVHRPTSSSTAGLQGLPVKPGLSVLETDGIRTLGLNPSQALQHPGFYYYMAGQCTENRRSKYLQMLESKGNQQNAPGLANERKVDHLVIILELYTKAYELFKKHSNVQSAQGQGRLTLWIAYRIAQTYFESGKFDMAVKFFERIAKTYRREKWGALLKPLLSTWYSCAKQLGNVELSVTLLVEMLAYGEEEEPGTLEEDLLAVLQSTVPTTKDESVVIDLADSEPLVDCTAAFWQSEIQVKEAATFQLTLNVPESAHISNLPFTSLTISFSDGFSPVTIRHNEDIGRKSSVCHIDLGAIPSIGQSEELEANMRWHPGDMLVFSGLMSSDTPRVLEITKLQLTMNMKEWTIELPFTVNQLRNASSSERKWLSSLDPPRFIPINHQYHSSVTVLRKPYQLSLTVSHPSPAYVDEVYPVDIAVSNDDDLELDVLVDILLQPTEVENAGDSITIEGDTSNSLIKGVSLGSLAPGAKALKTLLLQTAGGVGDRTLDISVQSRPSGSADEEGPATETLQTLVVPVVAAFKTELDVAYHRSTTPARGIADPESYDADYWDDGDGGEAVVTAHIECPGPWEIEIQEIQLVKKDGPNAKVVSCSLETEDSEDFPARFSVGDCYLFMCQISLAPDEDSVEPISAPAEFKIIWKRVSVGDKSAHATSTVSLPALQPPRDGLIALLDVPPLCKLHEPIPLRLTIRNRHPSNSANIAVQLLSDPADAFVVSGLRTGRVPLLLPQSEEVLMWKLIPVECGYVQVPRFKVLNRRRPLGAAASQVPGVGAGGVDGAEMEEEVVRIIDWRCDKRSTELPVVDDGIAGGDGETAVPRQEPIQSNATVLVLP